MTLATDERVPERRACLTVLVGVPEPAERARVTILLRNEGHYVVEAANAGEMQARLDELSAGAGTGPDAIVCAGLLAERDDPGLSARLAEPTVARALILLPAGGLLS